MFHLLVHSHPKCLQQLGLRKAKARSQEFISVPPHEWQDAKYLGQHLFPPRVYISRKIELEAQSALVPRHSNRRYGPPKWYLNLCTKGLPQVHILKLCDSSALYVPMVHYRWRYICVYSVCIYAVYVCVCVCVQPIPPTFLGYCSVPQLSIIYTVKF